MTVLNVPVRRLGEGFDIPDEVGLHELDGFVTVIQLLFELHFLGSQVLGEVVGPCFGSDDQPVDDGSVGVGQEVMASDGGMD